jgi:hypothetical protein
MGGPGSGRLGSRYKLVERCVRISSHDFARGGVLRPGQRFEGECDAPQGTIGFLLDATTTPGTYDLTYAPDGSGDAVRAKGALWWTPAPRGLCGLFGCPECERRCVSLYLPRGGAELACRLCHGLTYVTQHLTHRSRLERRSRRLYRQAGSAELGATFTRKPYRMRWRTFNRLMNEAAELEHQAASTVSAGRLLARLTVGRSGSARTLVGGTLPESASLVASPGEGTAPSLVLWRTPAKFEMLFGQDAFAQHEPGTGLQEVLG